VSLGCAGKVDDPVKQRVMRLPPELAFGTKGQLAIDLLGEVLADGIWFAFACGDEGYGSCTQLREFLVREFLEGRSQAHVLRVPSSFCLTVARGVRITCKNAAADCPPSAAAGKSARPGTDRRATAGRG
jgi:virulence-associated protein VagC